MEINTDPQKIKDVLERGVEEVINRQDLLQKMASGKQLRIKFGIDPTAPDIHLGHTVGLRKLAQFQRLGHKAILIIGDFTTLIGDPSGRTTSRPPLTSEQIRDNMKDYIKQAARVININNKDICEIHYNSEWFGDKPMSFLMDLAGRFTVARLIEREDFQKRLKEGLDVSMLELLYPLLQGYDSVAVSADVELGGYDQRLNLLFGRKVQRAFGQPEQDVITVPLLIGIDGIKKMSKSVGNYIRADEDPNKMFARLMEVNDDLMWDYFKLLTNEPIEEIEAKRNQIKSDKIHPRDIKIEMARKVVELYYGAEPSRAAEEEFIGVTQQGKLPANIPVITITGKEINIIDLVMATGIFSSKSEVRRLIEQNGIKIDGQMKNNIKDVVSVCSGQLIQVGKNKYFKVA